MSSGFTLGIIAAMEEEVEYLRSLMQNVEVVKEGIIEFYKGTLEHVDTVLVRSGIGKVNASIAATLLVRDFNPTCIINTGSAGGVTSDLKVGDVVISSSVFHHDFDLKPIGFEHGEVPGLPIFFQSDEQLVKIASKSLNALSGIDSAVGQIGTGEFFVSSENYVDEMKKRFPEVMAIEMEAAAIAQVCYLFKIPFVVIRALSDVADNESPVSFDQFVKTAGKNSAKMVIEILHDIKNSYKAV